MCTRTPTDCTGISLGVSFFFFFWMVGQKLQAAVARKVSVPVQMTCVRRDRREERTEVKAIAKAQTLHDARNPTVSAVSDWRAV